MPSSVLIYEEPGAISPIKMRQDDQEPEDHEYECEECLGPDDPGVGPWMFEFYD